MERTHFIEHGGVRILLLDFSHVMDEQLALGIIAQAKSVVATQAEGSLLTLTNVEGSHFDSTVVAALRDLVEHNRPKPGSLSGGAPVVQAPSIGPKTAKRLEAVGVKTVADLLALEPEQIEPNGDRHNCQKPKGP